MVDEDSHSTDLSARYLREGTFFIRVGGGGVGRGFRGEGP